jgi:hypothetical protein
MSLNLSGRKQKKFFFSSFVCDKSDFIHILHVYSSQYDVRDFLEINDCNLFVLNSIKKNEYIYIVF